MSAQRYPVESVEQFVVRAPNVQTKINAVKHWLTDTHPDSRALLFVRTKEDAKRVHRALADIMADQVCEIHSNKAQHTRLAAMSKFRQGDIRVLVSTDVSARGIDVPETEVVINFNVPRMSDDYVHRIGRTGRADRSGTAYTLVDPTEEVGLKRILDRLPATGRPLDLDLPSGIHVEETPPWEVGHGACALISSAERQTPRTKAPSTRRRKGQRKNPKWGQKKALSLPLH